MAEVELAEASASELQSTPHGRLRLVAPVSFGTQSLVPALVEYMRRNLQVSADVSRLCAGPPSHRDVEKRNRLSCLPLRIRIFADPEIRRFRVPAERRPKRAKPEQNSSWPTCRLRSRQHYGAFGFSAHPERFVMGGVAAPVACRGRTPAIATPPSRRPGRACEGELRRDAGRHSRPCCR